MTDEQQDLRPLRHLRAHREGVLIADGKASKIRFVIDAAAGRIVFPTTPAIADSGELVLFVPEEDPTGVPELQLLLSPGPAEGAASAACDRWEAYHGDPEQTRWLACGIESARFAGEVLGGDLFRRESTLRKAEPALCGMLNADQASLTGLCQREAGVSMRDPRAVGVDDLGIDVRARFGIVRVPFPHAAADQADAEGMIRSMLARTEA